ncbi:AAA family ATPase [Anaerococcus sp. AGMB09787]|uniref:ATP-binding protein n=1 Tax=Anaerococcus sp. AGMB09787 TaxID=2922869 RepID=UPI001FAF4E03|nr:AAA family ATPase [Anaerococcus sp. AGMB09787]
MTRVYIKRLNIISFGKFENLIVDFDSGFNLIYGKNESGKSTLASFIEGILYGFDEGKTKTNFSYKKEAYKPKLSYRYGGSVIFNKDGYDIEVSRNFDDGSYSIRNLSLGEDIEGKKSNLNYPGEYLLGLDYSLYKAYIANFTFQKSEVMAKSLILEKLSSKDIDFNFSPVRAIEYLEKKDSNLGSGRAYTRPYAKTKKELDEVNDKLYEINLVKQRYYEDFKKLKENKDRLKDLEASYQAQKNKVDYYRNIRGSSNFRDYQKWTRDLQATNEDLKEYRDLVGLDDKYFEDLEKEVKTTKEDKSLIDKIIHYSNYILLGLVPILGILVNKYFFLLIIPILYLIIRNNKGDSRDADDMRFYKNKRARYLKYKAILKEKEKIEEVLAILKKQDLIYEESLMGEEVDFDALDIEKEEERLYSILEDINTSKDKIASSEKSLVTIEEKISNELDILDRKNQLEKRLSDIKRQKESIRLAISTIKEICKENEGDIGKINQRVNDLVRILSKDKYESIIFDKDLNPQIKSKDSYYLDLDQLSKGFMDQLYFALKLSLNDEAFSKIFMVFDDSLINYDIERLRSAILFLLDTSEDRQVIYFTCHKREEEFLSSEGISINYLDMEKL